MGFRFSKLSASVSLTIAILVLIILAGAACTGGTTVPKGWSGITVSDGVMYVGSMQGELVAVNITDGNRLWSQPLTTQTSGGLGCAPGGAASVAIYGAPSVGHELIYVAGYNNGKIYAFSSAGSLRWVYPREGVARYNIVGGVVVSQGNIYFASSSGTVTALDAETGDWKWDFKTGDKIWSTPNVDGGTLYIGSFDKKLYAVDAATGKEKWQYLTGGVIAATPIIDNNIVYVGSFDRKMYAIDATTGQIKWTEPFLANNWFWSKPVILNGAVYAPNLDGNVYVLKADTGEKIAEFPLGAPISSSPVVANNSVIVSTENVKIYALSSGTTNATRELVNLQSSSAEKNQAPLATDGKVVYIHTSTDEIKTINAESGARLWSISLKSAPPASSNSTNWPLLIAVAVIGVIIVVAISALGKRRKS